MRKLLFAVLAAALASTASASEGKPFLGVGAKFGVGSATIVVPMNVTPMLRVEPFLGYWQDRSTDTTGPDDVVTWDSQLTLGAGVFVLKDLGSNVELSFGGRLSINREADGFDNGTTSDSNSDVGFAIAAVGGLEYYFSPKFSLGVEGELYVDTIKHDVTDVRSTEFGTASFVTARVFF